MASIFREIRDAIEIPLISPKSRLINFLQTHANSPPSSFWGPCKPEQEINFQNWRLDPRLHQIIENYNMLTSTKVRIALLLFQTNYSLLTLSYFLFSVFFLFAGLGVFWGPLVFAVLSECITCRKFDWNMCVIFQSFPSGSESHTAIIQYEQTFLIWWAINWYSFYEYSRDRGHNEIHCCSFPCWIASIDLYTQIEYIW